MMNAKQLREVLFHVENQKLTVEQLRAILFDIDDDTAELGFNFDSIAAAKANAKYGRNHPVKV